MSYVTVRLQPPFDHMEVTAVSGGKAPVVETNNTTTGLGTIRDLEYAEAEARAVLAAVNQYRETWGDPTTPSTD